MTEAKDADTTGTKVLRLSNYLNRAHRHDKPSILFALYLSEFLRSDVERSLLTLLKEQGLWVVSVDAGEKKDLPSFFSSIDSDNTVFFVYNIEKGFPEVLQFLNFKREELVEDRVKVIFWVTEEELSRISRDAPDFFAFRNRVVEFMEVPHVGEIGPALVEFALETEYKSLDEIKRSIELKEKLLSELSTEQSRGTEISGYLLGSLGNLYVQIGLYEKSIDCNEKALAIAREVWNRHNEGNALENLGNAYSGLGQIEKAIGYYEEALEIAEEIGAMSAAGNALGNLGNAYSGLGQIEKAIGYYKGALDIAKVIGAASAAGNALRNLGNAYSGLGQIEKAIGYYEEALEIAEEIGAMSATGNALRNLGNAYSGLGQIEKSIGYYEEALYVGRELKDPRLIDFCEQKLKSLKNPAN